MPGVSIRNTQSENQTGVVEQALDELRYFERYTDRLLRNRESWTIGATAYPSYPIAEFDTDEYWICLEGEIYDRPAASPLSTELERIVSQLFGEADDESRRKLRRWLCETDGEFVLYAVEKSTGRLAVLNDLFGRLPVYYTDADTGPVFTREIGFFFESPGDPPAFDRYGLAQYLLFGYTLQDRTLWKDVQTLPPATQVIARPDGTVSFRSVAEFDFGDDAHDNKSVDENARNLAALFRDACEARSNANRTNVLSLSGGHDSRSVAAAFHASNLPCSAATFRKATRETSSDATIARKIARALDFDWQLFTVDPVKTSNADTLLTIKRGLNHLGLAFLIDFFEQVRDAYGPGATYFTGDGGDKTLPDLSPAKPLSTHEELVSYTIARNSVFSLQEVAAITGLDRDRIVDDVSTTLASYPESDPSDRYVHFLTHERGFSWLFEGEDRNRYFFWSTSPFYSAPFFRYAMNVPDEQKSHNRLYREFLRELWPQAIEFDDADFRTPMASPRYKLVQYGLSFLGRHPSLEDVARVIYRGETNSQYHPNIARILDTHTERSDVLDRYVNTDAVRTFADDRSSCGHHQIYTLLTVSAAIVLAERGVAFASHERELEAMPS